VKKSLFLFLTVLIVFNAAPQEKRLALVIGNSNYIHGGTLANPENDADSIGKKLINLGFNVLLHKNLDQKSMQRIIDDFGTMLKHYNVGLFFYAGHGIQAKGINYLIPVDADIKTENDVEYNCVKTGRLLAKMEDASTKVNIMILDACRDNPFERQWTRSTTGKGLAFMDSPVGTLIAYSTAPGTTASDGYDKNSPYTSALLNYAGQPGITILQMFQYVRKEVREKTDNLQIPWESTSLEGNFYFVTTEDKLVSPPANNLITNETEFVDTRGGFGYLIDKRDGQKYKTVKIGTQIWMAENLNYEHDEKVSFCYEELDLFCSKYGRLYPWHTAMEACPSGWHLPGDEEWKELEIYFGMSEKQANKLSKTWSAGWSRGKPLGKQLQENDSIGFNLLAGYAIMNEEGKYVYLGIDIFTRFWTSTKVEANTAISRGFDVDEEGIKRDYLMNIINGFPVRCVKDDNSE
jgi:uncharacterized protein (TIGR02145 family)